MMRLKPTSRLGKRMLETRGTTLVGNRAQTPRSDNDRASHADQLGLEVGDPVTVLGGPHKGRLGVVRQTALSQFGGGPRIGVELSKGAELVWMDADNAMNALKARARFGRGPGR